MKRTVFAARWCLPLEAIVLTLGCSATQPPPNSSVPAMSSVAAIATELGRRMTQDFPGPLSLDRRLGVSAVSRCLLEPGLRCVRVEADDMLIPTATAAGARMVSLDSVTLCRSRRECARPLSAFHLRITEPVFSGDSAEVDVTSWTRIIATDGELYYSVDRYVFRRQDGGWRVTGRTRLIES